MVTKNEIRESIERLNVWKRGGHRAPHKPLLLLVSMARAAQDGDRRFSFAEVDEVLVPLLREFGKPGARPAPELPFWHLQTDGLWELQHAERPVVAEPSDFPGRRALRDGNYVGALPADVFKVFAEDPEFRREMGLALLRTHFPETLHQDVLDAVGLNLEADLVAQRRRRDPRFRLKVIRAYERRCAVCGYGVWLEEQLVGIEAAHIRWHQAGGPDTESNGLAMCALHHKLFDRGVFSVDFRRRVIVSELVHGVEGVEEWLLRFHGAPLRRPVRAEFRPADRFIGWHQKQVFRGPGREVA